MPARPSATGRQLWPVATLAEYRLALVAPPDWAARVIDEDAGPVHDRPAHRGDRPAPLVGRAGPLLATGPRRRVGRPRARRCAARRSTHATVGAACPTCSSCRTTLAAVGAGLPARHVLRRRRRRAVAARAAASPPTPRRPTGTPSERLDDDAVELAVRQLVETWTASSNGRAEVACVEGERPTTRSPRSAVRAGRAGRRSLAEALAWLAWAGASGGAHGRRRGAALGPLRRPVGARLRCSTSPTTGRFRSTSSATLAGGCAGPGGTPVSRRHGWRLQLAVEDAESGTAWAISAVDAA